MTESTELVAAEQPQQVALTVQDRAVIALGGVEREEALKALAKKYDDITEVKNKAGRQQVHGAAMELANERIATKKTGETAREDAVALQKAVIERQKFLIGIIEPPEKRLLGLRDKWDEAEEAERAAKLAAEQARVAAIRQKIDAMRNRPAEMVGRPSDEISAVADVLSETVIALDDWQEFTGEAISERNHAVAKLREMQAAQLAVEQEQARLAEERATLAREREEAAERDRQAALARQREEDEQRITRAKEQAAELARQQANQKKMDEQRREIEQQQAAQQAAAQRMADATEEIQGIQQQVIIAQSGRLGVRKGGTIECLRETLAETEAWELDPERFGILAGAAESAKTTAVAEIRRLLAEAEAKEREDAEARRQREEAERAAAIEAQRVAEAEAAEAARVKAEKDAAEREQIRRVRVQFEKNGPGDEAIVARLADIFDVKPLVVVGWLEKFNAAAFRTPEEKAA